MNKLIFVLMLTVAVAQASTHSYNMPNVPHEMQKHLESNDFLVDHINCKADGTNCDVILDPSETKNPSATIATYVYVNPATTAATLYSDIAALAVKLRADTITADEKDDLLDKMLQHQGF